LNRVSPRWIFLELRRRRVFNTVAIYIVGAWVALQVADLAFPGIEVPESAIRYVWMGAFLLFPLALIFGWRYDISANGILLTPSADAPASGDIRLSRQDYWLIGAMSIAALAVIAVMLVRISEVEPDIVLAPPENSIAVMPFEVCEGHNVEQKMGLQLPQEVINRLSERGTLKVIARTSSYNLAGFGWSTPHISRQLGVEYVLSGEVCRDGEVLTITAELRDKDDFIVMRKHYEQVVNRFDQIESRVASQVADGVAAELGDVVQLAPDAPVNRLAYEQLLIANELYVNEDYDQALITIDKALNNQPDFAQALLLRASVLLYLPSDKSQTATLENSIRIGEEALGLINRQLESGRSSGYLQFVAGTINHELGHLKNAWSERQGNTPDGQEAGAFKEASIDSFLQAERHLRSSIALKYPDTYAYTYLADTLEHLGGGQRRNEAVEVYERALELDPLHPRLNEWVARSWSDRGRYRQGIELLERFKALPVVPARIWKALEVISFRHAYFIEYCELELEILLKAPEEVSLAYLFQFLTVLEQLGLQEEADEWYNRLKNMNGVQDWMSRWYLLYTDQRDQAIEKQLNAEVADKSDEEILDGGTNRTREVTSLLALSGDYERAARLLESLWLGTGFAGTLAAISPEKVAEVPMELVELYHQTGRSDDAIPLLEETIRYLQAEYDMGIRHPQTLYLLAEAYAYQGQDEAALEMLKKAVDYHARWPVLDAKYRFYSPWDRFRDDPRFIRQWSRMEADLGQQAESIRAILAQYDVDELLAPLMSESN
jgi:TolB-like protein